ncbi:hypothetical protein GCK32_022880 [Trichostrongylus colubriformis]|uniref:Uncharacterized protein n=1 Tax=Trichostrongylus colubriformis TaxID=6319 RepID=A0AAN8FNF7_TRICO
MYRMKESEWRSLILAPHETIDGKTLLVKLNDIEQVAADQITNIAGITSLLHDLQRDFQGSKQDEKTRFEQEVCTGIKRIQKVFDELPEHYIKRMRQAQKNTAASEGLVGEKN